MSDEVPTPESGDPLPPISAAKEPFVLTKGTVWAGAALVLVLVLFFVAKAAHVGQTCGDTSAGQHLCGADLKAWCKSTDTSRASKLFADVTSGMSLDEQSTNASELKSEEDADPELVADTKLCHKAEGKKDASSA